MTFQKAVVLSVVLLIAASSLSASQTKAIDISGVWTGTYTGPGGQQGGAHLDLKQKGDEVTGTSGPAADRQVAISNGKVTVVQGITTITFDMTRPDGTPLRFDLNVVDGRLKGKATIRRAADKREALIDVGRAK